MRRKLTWTVLFSAAIIVTGFYYARKVHATPAQGFTSTRLAPRAGSAKSMFLTAFLPGAPVSKLWLSWQKTKGSSDLYVQSNVWQPRGNTGWHSHPGHTLVTVTAGTITAYEGDDPECKPHVYTAGMGFVDPGGTHVHSVRNESASEVAQAIAVRLVPAGQPGRCRSSRAGELLFLTGTDYCKTSQRRALDARHWNHPMRTTTTHS